MNDTITPRFQILFLALITAMVLLQVVPSFAQPSTPTNTSSQETSSQGRENSSVPAQMEPTPSGQPNSGKSATEESWKLYVNDTYHYEFRYPPWGTLDASKPAKVIVRFFESFKYDDVEGTDELDISFAVHDNLSRLTAEQWVEKEWKNEEDRILAGNTVDISGVHGYKIKVGPWDYIYYIYLPKGTKIYEILFPDMFYMSDLPEAINKRYDEIFRKIVSTFRFR